MNKKLQFPIGPYQKKAVIVPADIAGWINDITYLPTSLKEEIGHLSSFELDQPYRKGGWTLRQVTHHIGDCHLNGYLRMKRILTEENPRIMPYQQDRWAKLSDYTLPVTTSLKLIEGLHKRWANVLQSLSEEELEREGIHQEDGKLVLKNLIGFYAWHGEHHLGHIKNFKQTNNSN